MPESDSVVIGLDLGTTTAKAVALDQSGRVCGTAHAPFTLQSERPGWVTQEPGMVWQGAVKVLRDLAEQLEPAAVRALSVGGAMHTLMPVNLAGDPLAPAMSWADSRAKEQAAALRDLVDAHALYQRTGCPLRSTYHPARLQWWKQEAPEVARQARFWVSLKDWVLHRLTGVWATDTSYASTTGLFDIRERLWDEEALDVAGIGSDQLPTCVPSTQEVGQLDEQVARSTGLPVTIPVIAGGNDGGLAQLGAGATTPNDLVITVGTSGAIRHVVEQPVLDPKERTWCYVLDETRWFAGGAINNGGLTQHWLWERFYPDIEGKIDYDRLMRDAAKVPPGAEGLFVLPFFTGTRSPYWNPALRATIHGLGLNHRRAHVVRATLEGVCFCLADVWEALCDREAPHGPVKLTGGITQDRVWTQILASVLGVSLLPIEIADASAVGAALVGWQGVGQTAHLPGRGSAADSPFIEPEPAHHEFYVTHQRTWRQLVERLYGEEATQ